MQKRRPHKKICMYCGEAFEASAPNQKFCSLECSYKNLRDRREAWENMNPNYNRDYYLSHRGTARRKATDIKAESREVI